MLLSRVTLHVFINSDRTIVTDETRVGLEKQCCVVTINVDGVKEVGRGKYDEPLWGGGTGE